MLDGDNANRHAKLADDSVRICMIIPKSMDEDVRWVAKNIGKSETVSSVIRRFIGEGLRNYKRNIENHG